MRAKILYLNSDAEAVYVGDLVATPEGVRVEAAHPTNRAFLERVAQEEVPMPLDQIQATGRYRMTAADSPELFLRQLREKHKRSSAFNVVLEDS